MGPGASSSGCAGRLVASSRSAARVVVRADEDVAALCVQAPQLWEVLENLLPGPDPLDGLLPRGLALRGRHRPADGGTGDNPGNPRVGRELIVQAVWNFS